MSAPAVPKRRPGRDRRKIGHRHLSRHRGPRRADRDGADGGARIHPWGSTVAKLETPDRITFDLDPDVGLPWERVTEAAIEMREALLGIGLRSFPKTTGGKGLHVVVPIAPKLDWERSRNSPNGSRSGSPPPIPTASRRTWRSGRAPGASLSTICATAAARPRSAPIRRGRGRARRSRRRCSGKRSRTASSPDAFTVATVPERLAGLGSDPWAEMRELRQSISARVRREAGI